MSALKGQRDLLQHPGRIFPRRPALRLHPADRMQPPLLVLRHAVCVRRGIMAGNERHRTGNPPFPLHARGGHRGRAAAPGANARTHPETAGWRVHGSPGDERQPGYRRRRRSLHPDRGREMPLQRSIGQKSPGEPRNHHPERRGQVRHRRPGRFRLCKGRHLRSAFPPRRPEAPAVLPGLRPAEPGKPRPVDPGRSSRRAPADPAPQM